MPSTVVQTHLPWGKISVLIFYKGTRGGAIGRYVATSRKVAGSISDGVIDIFHYLNASGLTIVLELTQPLKEMSTRNVSWWVKAASA